MNLLTWRRRGAWRGGWLGALAVTVALGGGAWEALAAPEQDFGARVKRWEHLVERGEPEAARAELDTVDLDALTGPAERLVVASLYALAGDRAKAAAIAGAVTEPEMASQVMAVTRPEATVAELLGDARGADACARTDVAVTLGRVGRPGEVVPYLRAVLSRAPDCAAAAQRLAVALIDAGDGAGAAAIAAAALEHDPKNAALQLARISALQMNGDLSGAIDALERLVRSPERQQGHMGLLLAMYLRERRVEARLDYWMKASEAAPAEVVPRFMVGVLLHYGNHFAASDTWLVPLFEEMPGEPRLFVYHAMNLFNLGQPAKARELLETAAALPVVDPDVYYCRAEVTRDTERELAIADFRRFLSIVEGQANTNPVKEARVREMLAALEQCAADGTAVCDGPWEHPRLRGWEAPWVRPALAGLLAAVVAAIGVVLWRRRRATGAR
jgi:tetratricopeptide (TPR) repeat protein